MIVAPISSLRVGLKTILAGIPNTVVIAEAASLDEPGELPPGIDIIIFASLEMPSISWLLSLLESFPSEVFLFMMNANVPPQTLALPVNNPLGLLDLDALPEEIAAAITSLRVGLTVIEPRFMDQIRFLPGSSGRTMQANQRSLADTVKNQEPFLEPLTGRENEILQALALGLTNKEIARRYDISEHTVKYHIASIYSKLGVNNRTEAVRQGVRLGIITI